MSRRATWGRAGLAALSLFLLVGCGDEDSTGATKNPPLYEFNAFDNGGRTSRWKDLPIRVFLGNGVARPDEVSVWTGATAGVVTFVFVGTPEAANIKFRFTGDTQFCGRTFLTFEGDLIVDVDTEVSRPLYRGPLCVRTVTHETAHGVGFLSHTSDGGLMDPDGGNGVITPVTGQVLRDLYLLPPGTLVTLQTKQLKLQREGRRVMTFTYPVRQ